MCGRIIISVEKENFQDFIISNYHIDETTFDFKLPRYNVAPGQDVICVINDGTKYRVGPLKWGFIPSYISEEKINNTLINAKAETVAIKPTFKHSFLYKRCVIIADGFYEWKKDATGKIPMAIKLKNDDLFPLAGLWNAYTRSDGTKIYTCIILTTTPNDLIKDMHNRMPVILNKEAEKIWLNPQVTDVDLLTSLMIPYESYLMKAYPVATLVNNARVDTIDCIKPL